MAIHPDIQNQVLEDKTLFDQHATDQHLSSQRLNNNKPILFIRAINNYISRTIYWSITSQKTRSFSALNTNNTMENSIKPALEREINAWYWQSVIYWDNSPQFLKGLQINYEQLPGLQDIDLRRSPEYRIP